MSEIKTLTCADQNCQLDNHTGISHHFTRTNLLATQQLQVDNQTNSQLTLNLHFTSWQNYPVILDNIVNFSLLVLPEADASQSAQVIATGWNLTDLRTRSLTCIIAPAQSRTLEFTWAHQPYNYFQAQKIRTATINYDWALNISGADTTSPSSGSEAEAPPVDEPLTPGELIPEASHAANLSADEEATSSGQLNDSPEASGSGQLIPSPLESDSPAITPSPLPNPQSSITPAPRPDIDHRDDQVSQQNQSSPPIDQGLKNESDITPSNHQVEPNHDSEDRTNSQSSETKHTQQSNQTVTHSQMTTTTANPKTSLAEIKVSKVQISPQTDPAPTDNNAQQTLQHFGHQQLQATVSGTPQVLGVQTNDFPRGLAVLVIGAGITILLVTAFVLQLFWRQSRKWH